MGNEKDNDVDKIELDYGETTGRRREQGAIGWGVLWLIGIPVPLLLVFFVLRGCT